MAEEFGMHIDAKLFKNKFAKFSSRRSVVHSTKGIVSCAQPLASQAGIKILEQGGNAADAAVASAAALNVTEPASTGIGGDMFCLFYDADSKKTYALNGSGRSGYGVTVEDIRKDLNVPNGYQGAIPYEHGHSVTVPGAAAGWCDTVAYFGSGKVGMKDVLQPAIEIAEDGFPVSFISAALWASNEKRLKKTSPNFAELLKHDPEARDGCRAPSEGEIFCNPELAGVFRDLANGGKKAFYEGKIAEAIVNAVSQKGGRLMMDDLKRHGEGGSQRVEPVSLVFSGQGVTEPLELWEHPPNGQGLVALLGLGMLQELEKAGKIPTFQAKDHNSVEYLHAVIECLRLAFSDGTWFVADPDVSRVPVNELMSPEYLKERSSAFSKHSCMTGIRHGSPAMSSSDTVYLSAADAQGNACSFINSNYFGFGSAIIPKGTGFALQNRGANFALHPANHANVFAPGKRPYHTIIPAMITNAQDGSLKACYGVMGGFMQPQGHIQVLMNMFVFKMNEQEALDAPRICIEHPPQSGEPSEDEGIVFIEDGIPDQVVAGLRALGHKCEVLKGQERSHFGRGQVIRRHDDGGRLVWSAGSDQRGDGHAAPLL